MAKPVERWSSQTWAIIEHVSVDLAVDEKIEMFPPEILDLNHILLGLFEHTILHVYRGGGTFPSPLFSISKTRCARTLIFCMKVLGWCGASYAMSQIKLQPTNLWRRATSVRDIHGNDKATHRSYYRVDWPHRDASLWRGNSRCAPTR